LYYFRTLNIVFITFYTILRRTSIVYIISNWWDIGWFFNLPGVYKRRAGFCVISNKITLICNTEALPCSDYAEAYAPCVKAVFQENPCKDSARPDSHAIA
jgi:hypothetical protein